LDEHPDVLRVADHFGTPEYAGPPTALVQRFRELLRQAFGVKAELTPVYDEGNPSPLQASLLQAWLNAARDPEISLEAWIREGVPLGINREIETNTIFPNNTRQKETWATTRIDEVLAQGMANYTSVQDSPEESKIEFDRLRKERFVVPLSTHAAKKRFPRGIISKQALLVKTKMGKFKRRVIVDLRRSGVNSQSKIPQRVVLPRHIDVVNDIRDGAEMEEASRQLSSSYGFPEEYV